MSEQLANPPDEQLEELVVDDIETIRAIADPMRMRLHTELDEPRTVKELARIVGVPQTRLYYHVKILERTGLIRVVSRRVVSGIEERTYQTTAKSTTISPALGPRLAETGAIKATFDMLASEVELALDDPAPIGEPDASVIALSMANLYLRRDQVTEFQDRMFELISEYNAEPRDQKTEYQLFVEGHRRRNAS